MKEKIKKLWEKYNPKDVRQKKVYAIVGGCVVIAVLIIVIMIILLSSKKTDQDVTETVISKKAQNTGVTETGSIDVGTTVQSFELDISEFTGESSFSVSTGTSMPGGAMGGSFAGGMNNMQMQSTTSSSSSSDSRQLEIEEVYVEAGQEIREGDPILRLTEETVSSIRTKLAEDVSEARIVYDQALTSSQQTGVEAESEYKMNSLYGSYSQSEYDQAVKQLQEAVTEKEETLTQAQQTLTQEQKELEEKETLLTEEKQVLKNATFTADGTDKEENLYWWIVAWQTKEDAETMVETLEEEIEQLKEDIEEDTQNIQTAQTNLDLANKALETGIIEAQSKLELRSFYAENAQEIYDVSTLQSAFSEKVARQDYEEAQQKLEEFDSSIVENVIYASYNGLITDVYVAAGDTLTQDMELVAMNDYDEVTITLSIEEGDMQAAGLGSLCNVTVAAFPDEVFEGEVTEIGDAQIDSNTNKTIYSVTVTVKNTNNLFYQDMTAEVAFVTEEVKEGEQVEE